MKRVARAKFPVLSAVALLLSAGSGWASAGSLDSAGRAGDAGYRQAPLINPEADPTVQLRKPSAAAPIAGPAASPGDGTRFNTRAGYPVGRFPEAVATGDFNVDGAVDVAYARSDFFEQGMTVQFNLGDGTMGPTFSYPATEESTDIKAGDLDSDGDLDLAVVSMGSSLERRHRPVPQRRPGSLHPPHGHRGRGTAEDGPGRPGRRR
jgi:hypothetical protein